MTVHRTPFHADEFDACLDELASMTVGLEPEGHWPADQLRLLTRCNVFGWKIPQCWGGEDLSDQQAIEGLISLGKACLTTAFILTQYQAAVHRIVACSTRDIQSRWLPRMASGEIFATVGLSHLTTSRSRGPGPAVIATPTGRGSYRLSGQIPWVTGGHAAAIIVVGGTTPDGQQILALVERKSPEVTVAPPLKLLSFTAASTGPIDLRDVVVDAGHVLAGPAVNVMKIGATGGTGSLTTSALAFAAGLRSLSGLKELATSSNELHPLVDQLTTEGSQLRSSVLSSCNGDPMAPSTEELRFGANSFAVRAAQCWLTAAKGTGFVSGHPAERAIREAMFFYVWSCPQAVVARHWHALAECDDRRAD